MTASRIVHRCAIVAISALLASCGGAQAPIPQSPAGGPQDVPSKSWIAPSSRSVSRLYTHYELVDTGTLGGPNDSLGAEGERNLNNAGQLISLADLSSLSSPQFCFAVEPPTDCHITHTALWSGELQDLGSLADGYSSGPIWISDRGQVAGFAQTGQLDPLTYGPQFHAVLYAGGQISDLGTRGGYESAASGINDAGDLSGCATTTQSDPNGFCFTFQASRAVLWKHGKINDLGTLGGPDALAELVNNAGDVAGWSLTNYKVNATTGIPTQHPFIYRHGYMHDVGTIGGTGCPNSLCVNDLNARGEFVGAMFVAGDVYFHPILWDGTKLRDLGTLGGENGLATWISNNGSVVGWANDAQGGRAFFWDGTMHQIGTLAGDQCSVAYGVNSRGQTVGGSWADGGCNYSSRAFIYEGGELVDLNQLIDSSYGVQLTLALTINESGAIAAEGFLANGEFHAFLLIPNGSQRLPKRAAPSFKMAPSSLMLPSRRLQCGPAAIMAAVRAHDFHSHFSAWHPVRGFSP